MDPLQAEPTHAEAHIDNWVQCTGFEVPEA